jgi:hypothetical protein
MTAPPPHDDSHQPRLAAEHSPRAIVIEDDLAPTTFRGRLFAGLRSLIAVIPLTLLIWIYAEREQI